MINPALPVSTFVNITESMTPGALVSQNTSVLLILGSSAMIDPVSRMRTYSSLTAIATDFGTTAPEFLAATPWFSQSPQPTSVDIGRWAQTATSGQLFGAPLSAAQQAIANFTAITDGGFDITVNGSAETVTSLNLSTAANLNAVASAITAKLTNSTCVWNSVYSQFIITSTTTGATSTVSFATPPAAGTTDISGLIGMNSSSIGAYVANGIVAETALAAATIFDAQFGGQWYAMQICGAADADHEAVSAFLAASTNKHFYGVPTQEAAVLSPTSTTDIAAVLNASATAKCAVQYSGTSPFAINSLLAKILTVQWGGSKTTIPLAFQTEPGITADNINSNQLAAAIAKNANVYTNVANGAQMIWPGICSNGQWIDAVIGADVLSVQLQSTIFSTLAQGVGQDDAGNHAVKTAMENLLANWVTNGFIATNLPWNQPGFGSLSQGQTLSKGYYVYAAPLASQPESNRTVRIGGPYQVAVKMRGFQQTVDVQINFQN